MKIFHRSIQNGKTIGLDLRCFGGWLVFYTRDVFCVWWSKDATPPCGIKLRAYGGKIHRERNGFWIIGSYRKWAHSKFA